MINAAGEVKKRIYKNIRAGYRSKPGGSEKTPRTGVKLTFRLKLWTDMGQKKEGRGIPREDTVCAKV